ncbi:glycosyltransferase [Rhodoblastus acidophilus]|uniref:Glycosyltransferase n=1 Tax=Rhodoblastus acidophilus TaxID=1074 RepID=A0A6N8DNV4_RHOAC|nr:glycosyltransferase [Rhodoblastus acidophilus]MCW2275445.1 glycosyltransferase involved in cell wall biosynthesis [Rhodoblastus acidophilus]MTV31998.1 glycosyltransferase [Rhodoblastus acidophilus]
MKLLFVHNNFPAQFRNLATALAGDVRVQMAAIGSDTARAMPGVSLHRYADVAPHTPAHSFSRRFDGETRRAEQVLYAATRLANDGFIPDLILVHPGWGENLPLRAVFPKAKIVVYCEYYYRAEGGDVGFDPEFPSIGVDGAVALDCKNASTLLALASCDAALSPTRWQKSTFPQDFQHKITVIHEGVDTDLFAPDPGAVLNLGDGLRLTAADEIVTYSARSLEPIRGFHSFMRTLPRVLEARPGAKIVIVGDDGVSYGVPPRKHPTWKAALLDELRGRIDERRVLFLGRLPYADYRRVLQISSAHVYLTYPFVLSWSLLEAMSVGCLVIGSDTAPVREMIDGDNGLLAPMFDRDALAKTIVGALADPEAHAIRRVRARNFVRDHFDARGVCTPKLIEWIGGLAAPRRLHEPEVGLAFPPRVEALRASGR